MARLPASSLSHACAWIFAGCCAALACASSQGATQPARAQPEGTGGASERIKNDRQTVPADAPDAPPGAEGVGPVSALRFAGFSSFPAEIGGAAGSAGQPGNGGRGIVSGGTNGAGGSVSTGGSTRLHRIPRW